MNKNCTVYKTVDFIGKRWTLLIILEIFKGEKHSKRYSQIKKSLMNITPKILSVRLKELVEKGIVKKKMDTSSYPITSEYSLTKKGLDFIKIIQDIKEWALDWNVKNKTCKNQDCEKCEF